MITTKKPPLKIRLLKISLTLLALSALLLHLAAAIAAFEITVRGETNTWEWGTGGEYFRYLHMDYGTKEIRDQWCFLPERKLSFALSPPFLRIGWPGSLLLSESHFAGVQTFAYQLNTAEEPGAPTYQENMTQVSIHWLALFWLLPVAAWIFASWRRGTLTFKLRRLARRALAATALLSVFLAALALVFGVRGYWQSDEFRMELLHECHDYEYEEGVAVSGNITRENDYIVKGYPGAFEVGWLQYTNDDTHTDYSFYVRPSDADMRTKVSRYFGAASSTSAKIMAIVGIHSNFDFGPNRQIVILIRPWLLLVLTLIAPAVWLHFHLRRKKRNRPSNHPLCPNCSYDLHAHNPGGRCPECGSPINETTT